MNILKSLLAVILTFLTFSISAQLVINDDPCDALPVTVETSCNLQPYTNLDATDSGIGSPSCGFYQGADVWFAVEMPATGHLIIDLNPGSASNPVLSIYEAITDCNDLQELMCNGNSSENGGNVGRINLHNESLGGDTLYIRVWNRQSAIGGTFDMCVWEPFIPDNDFCSDAVSLTVETSCTFNPYTNEHCTDEDQLASPTCGFYNDNDVWFTAVVPASGHLIVDLNPDSNSNPVLAAYTGDCNSLTQIQCNTNSSENGSFVGRLNFHDDSIAGETLYIRVWTRASDQGGSFAICAWEPTIPDNDFCENAIDLPVDTVCTLLSYTNEHCTDNSAISGPGCGFYNDNDVWFTTTVPASGHLVVDLNPGTNNNPALAAYTGDCNGLTEIQCNQNASLNGGTVGRLNFHDESLAGQLIYIRVWTRASVQGGTFDICAWEPVIPDNDFCENAVVLPVDTVCTFQQFSNEHCTEDSSDPNPGCGFYNGSDVWFIVTVPMSGHLIVDLNQGGNANPALAAYTGECGNLTEVWCNSGGSLNPGFTGRLDIHDDSLAGQDLYIRVWTRGSVQGGTFEICAFEYDIPDNDFCFDAFELPVQGVECNLQEYSNLYCTDLEDGTIPNPDCGFYSGTDVWFTVVMPASGQLIVDLGPIDYNNVALAAYTGPDCDNLVLYECDQNSSDNGSFVGKLIFNDTDLIGETIYLRVWRRGSMQGGTFGICAFDPDACGFFNVLFDEPDNCNPFTDSYTQEVTFSYLNEPGGLTNVIVNGQSFPVTPSPMTVMLSGLPINSGQVDLEIYFEDDLACFYFDNNAWNSAECCEGDVNNDGNVNVLDLLEVSSNFGCSSGCGGGDANFDGAVNILDLILISSTFGNNCAGL